MKAGLYDADGVLVDSSRLAVLAEEALCRHQVAAEAEAERNLLRWSPRSGFLEPEDMWYWLDESVESEW